MSNDDVLKQAHDPNLVKTESSTSARPDAFMRKLNDRVVSQSNPFSNLGELAEHLTPESEQSDTTQS